MTSNECYSYKEWLLALPRGLILTGALRVCLMQFFGANILPLAKSGRPRAQKIGETKNQSHNRHSYKLMRRKRRKQMRFRSLSYEMNIANENVGRKKLKFTTRINYTAPKQD